MKSGFVSCGLVAASLFAITSSANANVLAPGGNVTPDPNTASGSIIADTGPLNWILKNASNVTRATGEIEEIVVREITGFLDFIIVVRNDPGSIDSLERVTTSSFTGFTTDVEAGNPISGSPLCTGTAGVTPTSVDRSSNGSVVGFSYTVTATTKTVDPGTCSTNMVIATNATQFTAGDINLIDGGIADVLGFAPTAVPGPIAGAGLPGLILGIGGLIGLARRRRARVQAA
jgi:hypothetical protein